MTENFIKMKKRGLTYSPRYRCAFTLAEMMVVMLILTILLAAFAPLMTKRKTVDTSSPWHWAVNNSDIYYGLADSQTAIIGQNSKSSSDPESRLTLSTSSASQSYINLKQGSTLYGNLVMPVSNSIYLGGPYTSASTMTGSYNTGFGISALSKNTSGAHSTGIGYEALYTNTTGKYNTGVGCVSLYKNTTGSYNTALGYGTLYTNTTGQYNTGVGYDSLYSNTTGSYNTALGYSTLYTNTTGQYNTGVGYDSLYKNTTGAYNTALGYGTLYTNTTGAYNTALGYGALYTNTTGKYNVAIGHQTLHNDSTSSGNVAIGDSAMYSHTTNGQSNVAIGDGAMYEATGGGENTVVGVRALNSNTTGCNNTAVGSDALYSNTTGSDNTGIGDYTLHDNTTGSYNTSLGAYACVNVTTGSNKTCIGNHSGPISTDSSTTNVVYLGSSSTTSIVSGVSDISTYSDKRLKNIKSEYKTGLEAIREIVPVNFTYKKDKDKTLRIGVVAQDLQKVLPDAVKENGDGYLVVNQGNIFYTLLNAVKQLDNLVQGIINELKVIEAKLDTLIKQESAKDKKIKELEKRLDKIEKRSV